MFTGIPRPAPRSTAAALARGEMLVALCAGSAAAFGVLELVLSRPRVGAANLIFATLQFALLEVQRRKPVRAEVLSHVCLSLALLDIVVTCALSGFALSPAAWCLPGIPLLAGCLVGRRALLVWAGASLAAGAALAIVHHLFPPLAVAETRAEETAHVGLVVLVGLCLTFALRRLTTSQIGSLEQREATIRTLIQGLAEKNEELSEARDAALQASRAKGDFLAVMSHEIRTPLNAVLGLTSVLLDTPLSAEQRDLTGTIQSSGNALLALLNEILDLSKIEAGRLELESTPFDVLECAEDALELLGGAAAEKHLDLYGEAAPDVPARIAGDAGRVRQILVNLISNAIKFTPRGSVEVRLDVEQHLSGGLVVIHGAVRDTGIGIPESRLGALFEPFSQLDASTTRKFGGTGLGLAICRKLAERMNGRVWVESQSGQGSTFHFTFEATVVEPAKDTARSADRRASALLITPAEGTRRAVAAQLGALGVEASAFASPEEARSGAAPPADLLIVDHRVTPEDIAASLSGRAPAASIVLAPPDPTCREVVRRTWGPRTEVVVMPVRRSALAAALRRTFEGEAGSPPSLRLSESAPPDRRLRVLLAEDNSVNQRVMRIMLERGGHRVDVVGNGLEAITEVKRGDYDVVLMDVSMPEMDGLTATRTIREKLPAERQPYIIALTANVTPRDRDECAAAGMNGFLGKPVVDGDLRRALDAAAPAITAARAARAGARATVTPS